MRSRVRRGRLRTKIIAWSLIPTSIILFTIALVNFYAYQSVAEDLVFDRDRDLTHLAAGQLALQLSQETDFLALVRAGDIYGHDSAALRLILNRVSGITNLRVGQSGSAYLVDGSGQVIYHSESRHIGADFASQTAVQRVLMGEIGTIRTRDLDGQEVIASFAPVPDTPWGFVNQESWAEVSGAAQEYTRLLFILLALGLVGPVVVVTIGVRWITRPIARLVDAAQEIAEGNFDQRITVSTGDELEEMAEQFNYMAGKLQESYANLEHRVADRTKELETINAIATGISESLFLDGMLNWTLDRVLNLLNLGVGEISLWQDDHLVVHARRGLSEEYSSLIEQVQAEMAEAGQTIPPDRALDEEIYPTGPQGMLWSSAGIRVMAVVPLRAREKVLGRLSLATRRGRRPFTPEEKRLLRAVGDQLGLAVENAHLQEEARQRAIMEERNRLARELHDSVTQAIYGVTLYAEAAARLLACGQAGLAGTYLSELQSTAQESLREMRLLIFELRPPVLLEEGLVAALQARLEAVEGRGGVEVDFSVEGEGRLPFEIEEGLYRVAQEALNNALKHAQAQRITVHLCQDGGHVALTIADNGIGFDLDSAREHGGLGLCGMKERAEQMGAQLVVETAPREGTCVRVEVSL